MIVNLVMRRLSRRRFTKNIAGSLRPNIQDEVENSQLSRWFKEGFYLHRQGRFAQAGQFYKRVLTAQPQHFDALHLSGVIAFQTRDFSVAAQLLGKAIRINPDSAAARYNRATTLYELNRLDEALDCHEIAISLKPDYAEAYNNRGTALRDLKRAEEAVASYGRAISLNPDYAEAHNNRSNVLGELSRLEEALLGYKRAIALKPDYDAALCNQGNALGEVQQVERALASYDKAIAIRPDYANAYWNKSLLLILKGYYLSGWILYEWRLETNETKWAHYRFPNKLAWRGQADLRGKTLLIYSEQGLGDVIQFCRYLPLLQSLGAKLIFEVPDPLVSFISSLKCAMTVLSTGSQRPDFDAYCPLMSLPMVFKTTVESIPNQTPYLFSDPEKYSAWQQRLGARKQARIGLVWSGSITHKRDRKRSIELQSMYPLIGLPFEWHSLQKDCRSKDLQVLAQYPQIRAHHHELQDFSDTAALIDCLDLVITVDTSVAHVAGALGKPVWVLLPYAPDFRWMRDRPDSPWYPSARLYRQDFSQRWQPVLERVAAELILQTKQREG